MDPISVAIAAGAVTGVAAELARVGVETVRARLPTRTAAASAMALDNVLHFIVDLQERVRKLEAAGVGTSLQQLLDEPGASALFEQTVIAAATSMSMDKRKLLARAVSERLSAPAEAMQALASDQAVSVIPKLSADQLTLLAITAFIYTIRLNGIEILHGSGTDSGRLVTDAERAIFKDYVQWLRRVVSALPLGVTSTLADVAHLSSTGCVLFDRQVRRDINRILSPFGNRFVTAADSAELDALLTEWRSNSRAAGSLYWYWTELVQHLTLTPVGVLIGVAAFDLQTGEDTDLATVQRLLPEMDSVVDDTIWDGRLIRREFLVALDKAIQEREERGIEPWRTYGSRWR